MRSATHNAEGQDSNNAGGGQAMSSTGNLTAAAAAAATTQASASSSSVPVPLSRHHRTASRSELLWNEQHAHAAAAPAASCGPNPSLLSSSASGSSSSLLWSDPPPTVVLITSNLQHDFFTRFPKRKETMNRYWVGRKESERVLGLDPARGPLAQLMTWVRSYAAGGDGSDVGAAGEAWPASAPGSAPPAAAAAAFAAPAISISPASAAAAAANVIPHFQDELLWEDEAEGADANGEPGNTGEDFSIEDDWNAAAASAEAERSAEPAALDAFELGAAATPTDGATPTHPSTPPRAYSAHPPPDISTVTPLSDSASAAAAHLRSPNIMISPSPAMSSNPSTPSPTEHAHHAHLRLPATASPHKRTGSGSAIVDSMREQTRAAAASIAAAAAASSSTPLSSPRSSVLGATSPLSPLPPQHPPHSLPPDRPGLYVIHLRTLVDRAKPSAKESIERYGEYCLAGTEGARLCNRMDEGLERFPHECIVNTNRLLSSHTYRALKRKLQQIRSFVQKKFNARARMQGMAAAAAGGGFSNPQPLRKPPLKVAVIGGWTDEDVYHICYELRTRFQGTDLGTCSILTASPSSSQHWNTLSQLRRVMNVTVSRTIKELIAWFGLGSLPYRLPGIPFRPRKAWPTFEWVGGAAAIPGSWNQDIDGEILAHLYRGAQRLRIATLVGGFSPSIVLSVESEDANHVREAASVVKLASRSDIATEYQAFQRVEEMLGNNAPSVRAFIELGDRAGIKFRYTRMSGGGVRRLLDLFDDLSPNSGSPDPAGSLLQINRMIDEIFGDIFGGWYAAAHTEMFDLFSYYFDGFTLGLSSAEPVSMVHQSPGYLKSFISYVLAKPGSAPAVHFKKDLDFYRYPPFESETFSFPGCTPLSNLGLLFEKPSGMPYLRTLPPRRLYSTFAHGDANLQNFLLDSRNNIWVIDFFFTEPRNHVCRDLSKLWSCIMYNATEISSDAQFAQAFLISEELAHARDLHTPLPPSIPGLTDPHLRTIYSVLQKLWSHAGRMVKDRSSAVQFQLALVADAMRCFLYHTKNMYSKRWALATAVLLSEAVLIQEKRIHDVTPSWVSMDHIPMVRGSLGMTRSPGNRNYMRFERKVDQNTPTMETRSFFSPQASPQEKRTDTGAEQQGTSCCSINSAAFTSPAPSSRASKHASSTPSNFRRELTQAERSKKESTERLQVQAQHLMQRLSQASHAEAAQLQDEQHAQNEHARLMHEQATEKTRYEAEQQGPDGASRASASHAISLADGSGPSSSPSKHRHLTDGKKSLLIDEEEEDEDNEDADTPGELPRQDAEEERGRTGSTGSGGLTKRARMPRNDSTNLTALFNQSEPESSAAATSTPPAAVTPPHAHAHSHFALSMDAGVISGPRLVPSSSSSMLPLPPLVTSSSGDAAGASSSAAAPAPSAVKKKMPRLQKECLKLRSEGVTHMLLLITDAEFKEMGVDKSRLFQFMSEYGVTLITVSMPPGIMQIPLIMDLVKLSLGILCDERAYKLVLVSKGGFHRAGTIAACVLCALGSPPEQAIRLVRECRGAQAIGRDSREKNVTKFDLAWKNLLLQRIVQAGQLTQNRAAGGAATTTAEGQQGGTALQPWSSQDYTFV